MTDYLFKYDNCAWNYPVASVCVACKQYDNWKCAWNFLRSFCGVPLDKYEKWSLVLC